ncbi:MAG: LptA/OstA family protein [Pseudobdellovibrionaceae bacterium]
MRLNPSRLGFLPLFTILLVSTSPLLAQDATTNTDTSRQVTSDAPVEIEADDALEWRRNDRLYVARGNASAKQGDTVLKAEILRAYYKDSTEGQNAIYKIEAEGNVEIASPDGTVTGQKGEYLVAEGEATITGDNLKVVSKDLTVTAKDALLYNRLEGKFTAKGDAVAAEEGRSIRADILHAWTSQKEEAAATATDTAPVKSGSLARAEADGNVVIKTATETATGNHATYEGSTRIAELTGNVHLTKGPNTLEGARAQVNMETGVSELFGAANGGRVKGVFFPGSTDKNKTQ